MEIKNLNYNIIRSGGFVGVPSVINIIIHRTVGKVSWNRDGHDFPPSAQYDDTEVHESCADYMIGVKSARAKTVREYFERCDLWILLCDLRARDARESEIHILQYPSGRHDNIINIKTATW